MGKKGTIPGNLLERQGRMPLAPSRWVRWEVVGKCAECALVPTSRHQSDGVPRDKQRRGLLQCFEWASHMMLEEGRFCATFEGGSASDRHH